MHVGLYTIAILHVQNRQCLCSYERYDMREVSVFTGALYGHRHDMHAGTEESASLGRPIQC